MTILRRVSVALGAACALVPLVGATTSQDLTALFAPPTPAEIDAVRADWATRQPVVESYRLEATGFDNMGAEYHIVSHIVDNQRHYGAVRFPRNYVPGQPHPALLVCHGGLIGVSVEESANFLLSLPGQCIDSDYFLIIPAFRGEPLSTQFAGTFLSGGAPSYADRDVDDSRSLLSTVLANFPDIDHARLAAWGISRGASVALLAGVRDDRIRRVIDLFGFTDFALPSVRARLDLILNQGAQPTGLGRVAYESFVQPWLAGTMTLAEARLAWIRRSPCYFAADMPGVQAHHGLQDIQIDASHTQVLLGALGAAGFSPGEVEGYYYPNGLHGLNSLVGHGARVEPFLCALQLGPGSYCGPMTPHSYGLYAAADYRGSASATTRDFRFRVNNCPPSSVGILFISSNAAYAPSGAGFVCVGAGARRLGAGLIDAAGTFSMPVDLGTPDPALSPYFAIGTDVHMQLVYRDALNPNGAFNWSNGLRLRIEP